MITIKTLIEGGKATPTPAIAQQLAPLKLNIGQVISAVNEKTKEFNGMQVPVTIKVDPSTKEFEISIGTPSLAALIRKELNVKKLSKAPFRVFEKEGVTEEFKESLNFDKVVKIAKMKLDDLKTDDLKKAVKQVVASCVSSGVFIEEKNPKEILKEINEGKWDDKLK